MNTKEALDLLRKAMKDDPDYAHGWHCNIAMMCKDSMEEYDILYSDVHKIGNEAASRFMKLCFDVETSDTLNKAP